MTQEEVLERKLYYLSKDIESITEYLNKPENNARKDSMVFTLREERRLYQELVNVLNRKLIMLKKKR